MSQPIKLLVDECLGPPVVTELARMLSWDDPKPVIQHIFVYFKAGTGDATWIPQIAREGWILLTADRGRKPGAKLPAICAGYGVTHILMGPSLLHAKQVQKVEAIVSVWGQIKKCPEAPPGTRFALRLNAKRSGVILIRLVDGRDR